MAGDQSHDGSRRSGLNEAQASAQQSGLVGGEEVF